MTLIKVINRRIADNNTRVRKSGVEGRIVKTDNIGCNIVWSNQADLPVWYSYSELTEDTELTIAPLTN